METALIGGVAAADVLKKEHNVIADLFLRVADAASDRRKKKIGDRCLREIELHAVLGEKVFYPAVRRDLGEERLAAKALEELAAARRIVDELKELPAGELYNALFHSLRELVVAHIDEEETAVLPRVERSDMDVEQLGAQLLSRRSRIASSGVESAGVRRVAAVAAGVALLGAAAWLAGLFDGGRRRR